MVRDQIRQVEACGRLVVVSQPRMREEPWPPGTSLTTCPACGRSWRPFVGSRLPCHAGCLWTPADRSRIRSILFETTIQAMKVAEQLGVSISVVRQLQRVP